MVSIPKFIQYQNITPPDIAFRDVLLSHGLTVDNIIIDRWVNVRSSTDTGSKKSGWYIFSSIDGNIFCGTFGSFKENWQDKWINISESDYNYDADLIRSKMQRHAEIQQEQREAMYAETAKFVAEYFSKLTIANPLTNEYLRKKQIRAHGALSDGDCLIVPICDVFGIPQSYQKIYPDGTKQYKYSGKKNGGMFIFGVDDSAKKIFITEGFSTGASVFEATDTMTVAAFDAKNLVNVTKIVSDNYPNAEIILCADNDMWNDDPVKRHTGESCCKEACEIVENAHYILPKFKDESTRPTDFNDLATLEGRKEVRRQLLGSKEPIKAKSFSVEKMLATPKRQFLYGNYLARGYVSGTAASGGTGKTMLDLIDCVSMVTGRKLTYCYPHEQVNAWHFNLEDDEAELNRRIWAICMYYGIDPTSLEGRLFLNSGNDDRRLVVAEKNRDHTYIATPDVANIIDTIRRNNISYLCVDPFIKSHHLDENSNKDIDFVLDQYKEIAHATKCAISLNHHTPKIDDDVSNKTIAGNSERMFRGGGSMVGAMRATRTMVFMDKDECAEFAVDELQRKKYVRIDSGKTNISKSSGYSANWMCYQSVQLPNDDSVGVLKIWEIADASLLIEKIPVFKLNQFLHQIDVGDDDKFYSEFTKDKMNVYKLMEEFFKDLSMAESKSIIKFLLDNGYIYRYKMKNGKSVMIDVLRLKKKFD